eukprot:Clim_evm73s157 gene=Clim_evmTU73s157
MTSFRRFSCDDLLHMARVNLDPYTETYNLGFYLQYLGTWPDLFRIATSASGQMMGYVMGKVEGVASEWHGHVTAITVAPSYRRLGLADKLMTFLEQVSDNRYNGYFVDLFVRMSNVAAIKMYEKRGYVVYRRVIGYYYGTNSEDAYDMRLALSADKDKKSVIPLKRPVYPEELEKW